MRITEATENYMEAILVIKEQKGAVRSVDVARYLGFSKPTISQYMKHYIEQGLVVMGEGSLLELTERGRAIAEPIYERHRVLTDMFMHLGVPEAIAREDACRVEHDISEETFECIKKHHSVFAQIDGGR